MTPIAATTAGWPTRKKLAPSRQEDAPHQQPLSAFTALHETFQVFPWPQPNRTSVFAQYTLRVQDHDALQAQARLQAADIPPPPSNYPVPPNEQPAYAHQLCPDCTPVAQKMAREVMSLLMHPDLAEADQDHIVATIRAA